MNSYLPTTLLALLVFLISAVDSTQAQVKPGKYVLVVAGHDGGGSYGVVKIEKPGPVKVELNFGEILKGRIDRKGNFNVTSFSGPDGNIRASGSAAMRSKTYAIGSYSLVGRPGGVFMLGRSVGKLPAALR